MSITRSFEVKSLPASIICLDHSDLGDRPRTKEKCSGLDKVHLGGSYCNIA